MKKDVEQYEQNKIRKNLGNILTKSYQPQKDAKHLKGYKFDNDLSSMDTKVYVDKKTKRPLIVHRGTTTLKDVADDALIGLGFGKYGFRYNNAKRVTEKAEKNMENPRILPVIAMAVG